MRVIIIMPVSSHLWDHIPPCIQYTEIYPADHRSRASSTMYFKTMIIMQHTVHRPLHQATYTNVYIPLNYSMTDAAWLHVYVIPVIFCHYLYIYVSVYSPFPFPHLKPLYTLPPSIVLPSSIYYSPRPIQPHV